MREAGENSACSVFLISYTHLQLICWMGGNGTTVFGIRQVNGVGVLVMRRALDRTDLIKDWDFDVVVGN